MRTILLKSSDNEILVVLREAIAKESEVIRNLLELTESDSNGENILIPLPNVSGGMLSKVIEWIVKHVDQQLSVEAFRHWETEFLNLEMEVMYELIMAANYLGVTGLLHRSCQRIADLITGQQPEEIRRMFNIENDFSPEEEEVIRRQNAWVFRSPTTTDSN